MQTGNCKFRCVNAEMGAMRGKATAESCEIRGKVDSIQLDRDEKKRDETERDETEWKVPEHLHRTAHCVLIRYGTAES
jgi:hypothetical protein